jgi:hypothetical protein
MAKTAMERAIEKQQKEQRKIAREAQIRDRANAIVSDAKHIGTFRIMDKESEMLLEEILKQYDGNDNNYVNFNEEPLPRALQESISLGFEKLQMYGVLASVNIYLKGAMVTLSESGKSYFEDKRSAERQVADDKKRETSIMRKQYDIFISHANKDILNWEIFSVLSQMIIR